MLSISAALSTPPQPRACAELRILFVIPGKASGAGNSMIFARRQAETVARTGCDVESFFLRSRTSVAALLSEFVRFRRKLRAFRPHVIHAHFGTVTAVFAALGAGFGKRRIP